MTRVSAFVRGAAVLVAVVWLGGPAVNVAHAQDAKQLFEKNCVSCHGPAGKGDGPAAKILKPPPADLGAVAAKTSDADLAKVIKEGGKAVGKSALMPAYASKLNDEQISGLVQVVKGFASK